ncbi:hypothetical protein KSF_003330 [Reticulibacter mediterranei]|uniref:Uncharacterized protein n=1 Tax=Reticulibacter mediterranei TaxID=2778369 RepID=A0A8J3IGF5_9CHLR|nr:hypothetical protein KSF_003330 [Reticulibacter mediterranei]
MFVALDGVIEDPGWSLQCVEEGRAKYKYEELFSHDALLLGRKTYEGFAASRPNYAKCMLSSMRRNQEGE